MLTVLIIAFIIVCVLVVFYMARLALVQKQNLEEKTILHEEVEEALKKANEAIEAKSKFIAKISHEIRTPLNAVIGLSSLTLDEEGLDKEVVISLERIYSSGMTIMSIVNDLLDLSKMAAGKYELVIREYDVPDLLNDVISQNVTRIGSRPIEFVLNIDEKLPVAMVGDELRVRQIINNLLSNAFNYTKEGFVILNINGYMEEDDFWLIVQVQDTGIGISEEELPKIFSEYYQVNTDDDQVIRGTGLGLPITKTLTEMKGGFISAESTPGKGSVFTARFKQEKVTDTAISPDVIQTLKYFDYSNTKRRQNRNLVREPLPDAKVLVVDDVPTNLVVMKGFLKPYQMQVDCAENGRQAVEAIRAGKTKYDAVFLDHLLPDIDGIEVVRQIREMDSGYAKNIPVIAFTANTLVGNEQMFLDAGFQDFISKPITLDRLDKIVRRWIGETPSSKTPVYRIEGLDIASGIKNFGGDEELFFDTLRSFTENVPDLLKKAGSPSEDSLQEYTTAVHSIKGACRIIYANELAGRAEELEAASARGDAGFVMNNNEKFLSDAARFIADIEAFLANNNSSAS